MGSYDLVASLETEFCFQSLGSYGGSIYFVLNGPLPRYEQCMKWGGEEVDEVDKRRGVREHKGRKESGVPVCKPLSIFDQFFCAKTDYNKVNNYA